MVTFEGYHTFVRGFWVFLQKTKAQHTLFSRNVEPLNLYRSLYAEHVEHVEHVELLTYIITCYCYSTVCILNLRS